MRRAQKTHRWQQRPQLNRGPQWYPVAPIVYGCELPPKTTLAHKYARVLKRLVKGAEGLYWSAVKSTWQWKRNKKLMGYVKDAIMRGIEKLGLAQNIGGRWLITSAGRKAIGVA